MGLAREMRLPVIIHDREAHQETLEVLKSERAEELGGIIHCFSGDFEMAKVCIGMGFCISIPGSVTYRNAGKLREIVKKIPLESLVVETDAPFLTPEPFRGKRNEPGYVRYTAQKVAEIKEVSFEEVAEVTTRNALRIYGLEP